MVSNRKIKELIALLQENNLQTLEVQYAKEGSVKITQALASTTPVTITAPSSPKITTSKTLPKELSSNQTLVKSPMVGTIYLAPSPDKAAFASTGGKIKKGETLCLIEAMKMYNKITAPISGTITSIAVKNGQTIEYDQHLFIISGN